MFEKGYLLGGRYRILAVLGEGGMANVYLAQDIILQRKVAVKVLRLDLQKDPQTIQRFQREALATSELSHPHIVSILDVGSDHNRHYLVMEYVDGPDLEEYIQKNKPLALSKVINIMDQILSAMALAHKHNVIHRDLKPQNILMDKNGNIKIVDFGIAVALNQSTMTQTNTAMGSVHYMSPEQARGSMATKQSDIYSLGIILYELLMGQVPFGGENAVAIALKHFQEKTPSLRKKNPNIPQALENVVFKATAKDPRDRYKSILEMKEDLDTSLDPARKDEPVFTPEHDPSRDETIVLPVMNGAVKNTQEVEENNEPQPHKSTLWDNIKSHKWWWIGAGIAFLAIMVILIFALGRKDDINVPDVSNLTENQARDSILASGLKVGKVERKSSDVIKSGHIIRTTPAAGATIKNGQTVDLIISKGPELTRVPNVVGEDYNTAYRRLSKLGFKVSKEEIHSEEIPVDNVISQDVESGRRVNAEKTTIVLTVSKGANKNHAQVKLRDLTGYSLRGAQDYAKDNDLNLQLSEDYSDTAEKGTVIKQDPAPGTKVDRGSNLHLIISKGKKDNDDEEDSSSSSSQTNVVKSFTVPFLNTGDETKQGNRIQIYISDARHSIGNVYRDQYITSNQTYSIPFDLSKGAGHIRIVRDGNTILDEDINK